MIDRSRAHTPSTCGEPGKITAVRCLCGHSAAYHRNGCSECRRCACTRWRTDDRAVELELPGGETVRVERPDPEFAQAVRYLRALTGSQRGEARTPAAVAVRCVQILGHLRAGVPDLPVPTLAPGPDGMVGMTWDTDRDHLNLEVFPDGHVEVFHEDLVSGGLWSVDRAAGPPQEFLSRLRAAFAPR